MRHINNIVLHCTASPQNQKPEEILNYWKHSLGWAKPGYHFLITASGAAVQLLPIEEVSNGVAGHNHDSIHISYIGGVRERDSIGQGGIIDRRGAPVDNRTPEQKLTQITLVRKYSEMFPSAIICGHRDFSPDKNRNGIIEPSEWLKACPAFSVKDWLREIGFKTNMPLQILKTTANLNLREGAGEEFRKVGTILKGTPVKKIAEKEGWFYIEVNSGGLVNALGWVSSSFLS